MSTKVVTLLKSFINWSNFYIILKASGVRGFRTKMKFSVHNFPVSNLEDAIITTNVTMSIITTVA